MVLKSSEPSGCSNELDENRSWDPVKTMAPKSRACEIISKCMYLGSRREDDNRGPSSSN